MIDQPAEWELSMIDEDREIWDFWQFGFGQEKFDQEAGRFGLRNYRSRCAHCKLLRPCLGLGEVSGQPKCARAVFWILDGEGLPGGTG